MIRIDFVLVGLIALNVAACGRARDSPVFESIAQAATGGVHSLGSTPGTIKHVFVIAMENQDSKDIYGNIEDAPYLNELIAKYAHADDFEDELPLNILSEPHYIWMEAGTNRFADVTFLDDAPPSSTVSTSSPLHLVTQIKNAGHGLSWMAYQEGLDESTGACPVESAGFYAPKHNPFVFFKDVAGDPPHAQADECADHHRPYSVFSRDLASNDIANYVFITPDLCHDMHGFKGCPAEPSIRTGDTWLKSALPSLIDYAGKHGGVIFLTFDEGGRTNRMPFIAIGSMVKPSYTSKQRFDHGSQLKSVERILGLPPLPTVAGANDLSDLFLPGALP